MSAQTVARHRAAQRPSTPLTSFGQAFSGSAGVIGRRSALVAASSGLALAIAAPAAFAAPDTVALPQVDVDSLTQTARVALAVSPTVVVPADSVWAMEETVVVAEEPEPEPEPVRDTTTASRSADRTTTSAVPQSVAGNAVLEIAFRYIGVPYVYGGATPAGFDCSGFTQYVFAQVGISLPRSSADQRYAGTVVPQSQARPGDLLWWPGHVGIYVGDGQYIGARSPGTPLKSGPIYDWGFTVIRL